MENKKFRHLPAAVSVLLLAQIPVGALAAPFTGQVPGDSFLLEVGRDGDQPTDTCGNLFVRNAEIRYTRR